jgi:hypothetical protein
MRKIQKAKILIASLLVISMSGIIMAQDNNKTVTGTTIGHYQKPGAPVNITYSSTRVNVNEVSDVNISLTTSAKSGEMIVDLSFDEDLEQVGVEYSSITFPLSEKQDRYNIHLKVKGKKDGLYYIRLIVKIKDNNGVKMRALAVPIYVGDGQLRRKTNQTIMKALEGENLSISKAKETIEILK